MDQLIKNPPCSSAQAAKNFFHQWFIARNAEAAAQLLADEACFIGNDDDKPVIGKNQTLAYIQREIDSMPESCSYTIDIESCHQMPHSLGNVLGRLRMQNAREAWSRPFHCQMGQHDGGPFLVNCFHVGQSSRIASSGAQPCHAGMSKTNAGLCQKLTPAAIAGGMIGGYREERFPFYFVNQRMLSYLGYDTEAEFVEAIGGYITNCIHPEDQEMVAHEIDTQLEGRDEYVVEYRMQKKDGSYIWVRDLGHLMTSESGRPAISALCNDITAQKTAQQELLHLYNNIPGAVFRCHFDTDFSVISANDGLFEFTGYSREEFAAMGNRMSAVIHPDDLLILADKLNEQLKQGNAIHIQNRLVCKDQSIKWISLKGQLMQENSGAYFYCVFVDITEEKRLQERVRRMYEQEMAHFTEMASAGGGVQGSFNLTKNILESYTATADVALGEIGDTYDLIVGRLAATAMHQKDSAHILQTLERRRVLADCADGKNDHFFHFLRRGQSGMPFWSTSSFRCCLNPETGDTVAFFYTLDITEQYLREQFLARIAELDHDNITEIDILRDTYRLLSTPLPLEYNLPISGSFQANIRIFAQQAMDAANQEEYLRRLDYGYIKQQLEEKDNYSFVLELRNRSNAVRVKRFRVFYVSKELGRIAVSRTDVSEIVRRDQQQTEQLSAALVAAKQASVAKSDFLSHMSHEIRTPMNAIIGMSTIAAKSLNNPERLMDCISKIGISSRFLLSLINDILNMSRIESGKMLLKNERFGIVEFIGDVNSICYSQATAKGVEYECIVDPHLDDYYIGDAMKLQQVLINILGNAVKFTSQGGHITFSIEQRRRQANRSDIRFIINDTGVGMNNEFIPHIFEPFAQESSGTTATFGGTGLGLAIAKSIIDLMGGKLQVRSIKSIGTEFAVDVTLGTTEEAHCKMLPKDQSIFSRWHALVVDDDAIVCESTLSILQDMNMRAEWVDSGYKAIEKVQAQWQAGLYYDLILIDWKMPGMDGIETARHIRDIVGPDVTIIIMTAFDWLSIEQEAKLAGVNLTMSKPMFKSTLISAFSTLLKEKDASSEPSASPVYRFEGKRILLAEDNAINTEVAVMLLESQGFAVDTAENGLRAMELFAKSQPGYYSAILMDIRMPVMDGLSAAANIRQLSNADAADIPIIAMTANAFEDDIEKSYFVGMNAHLAKPVDAERLYQTLHSLIFKKES